MALFKIPQGSRGIMRLLLIQLVCCFGWFSSFALAQFGISEGVTGSVNFPALGITCVANLAVFVTTLIRGRLDLEMGARDALDILLSTKLKNIERIKHGNGLTTCTGTNDMHIELERLEWASVVMLSNGTPNWSMRQFMKSNAPIVHSIQLEFLPLQDAVNDAKVREELTAEVTIQTCRCRCNCIVFWTAEEITSMLARRMPGILKPLSSSLCLLPCLTCLTNGCHGCHKEGLLRVEGPLPVNQADEGQRLRERESKVVSEILNDIDARLINAEEHICICIPMHGASSDVWTELLVRSLRSKDAEGRGVRVKASEALEGYLAGRRGGANESVEYNISSFIVPRLTEVVINLVLTFWFRVDGFSSALLARRTIRDYLVDTKGSGLAANAFLTKAKVMVKSDDSCTQVCQVLFFRGNHVRIITFFPGCVNLICSLGWAVLISFEGGADTSPPPSMTILVLIIAAIATALGMDIAAFRMDIAALGMGIACFGMDIAGLNFRDGDSSFGDGHDGQSSEDHHLAGLLFGRPIMWQAYHLAGLLCGRPIISPICVAICVVMAIIISPIYVVFILLVTILAIAFIVGFIVVFIIACIVGFIMGLITPVFFGQLFDPFIMTAMMIIMIVSSALETLCIVAGSAVAGTLGIKSFGRWVYAVLQILVWLKWAVGSLLLNEEISIEFLGRNPGLWAMLVYSSAFMLNAVLAGVRCKWEAWPWKDNHLFSRKLGP